MMLAHSSASSFVVQQGRHTMPCRFGSVMILMFFTIMEIVFALIQKVTFLDQFKNIQLNTACGKALSAGLPEKTILSYSVDFHTAVVCEKQL